MQVIRHQEQATTAMERPPGDLTVDWLEGPHFADRLDVGLVTVGPGGVTPPHEHHGGQVMVVVSGRGFVETEGHRIEIGPGDVVICAPGELHTHGALPDAALAHFTVSTGPYSFPQPS